MRVEKGTIVALGYGKYFRSERIVGLEPIEEGRGPGQRTKVYVQELPDPLINIALAEKLAAWRTAKFFEERAARTDPAAWIVSWPALETSRRVRDGEEKVKPFSPLL